MNLPENIVQFMHSLADQDIDIYLVGGSVRDILLGRQPNDYDFTVNMTKDALDALAHKRGFYKLGKSDTYGLVLDGMQIELTPMKCRTESGICPGGDIYSDLECRDFTINAMAYGLDRGLIDPCGGVTDIEQRRIRALYPDKILLEDPIRSLRALRLSAQLGFSIDDALLRAIQEKPLSAGQVSPERVREEFFKLLCSNKASAGVRQLLDYGLGTGYLFFDCLLRTKDYDQENPYHNRTLLEHTLTVLENVPNSIELRLAALFHDVGKPDVKTIDTIAHYYGHELVSARIAEDALKELKCSTKLLTEVGILIEAHMFNPADMGKKGMKRLLAKLGGYVPLRSLLDLMRADIIGTACPERVEGLGRLYEMVDELEQEATVLTRKHLNIDGRDLIAIGFAEGREIGICLNELFEQVISDNLDNDRSVLLAYARHYLEMGGDTSAQGLVYDPD